ncbi:MULTISPECIES: porin family protein [unclassified Siphonobacter]|uniref:porin family protein n=1 Tax=unclassified Siphonobacter TaxID=2635712 RepID=UPI002787CE5C|nr:MULTISPECIES: porin family protein [unclassified Siphonobacter]MDQ1086689.1 hypothetical protein [Siphonobacter sp. SORGH_AS_1065]MDR6196950.1 hypothetical protein [Siphonobacter sp. SORGH_AS_0500]
MKQLTLIIAFTLTTLGAFAQETTARTGIRGGFSASNLRLKEFTDRNPRYGFHASLFTQIPVVTDFFYIQPEIGYTNKGTRAEFNIAGFEGSNTFKLNYVEVPVLATFKIGNFVDLHAGPYVAYLLKAAGENTSNLGSATTTLNTDAFKRFDYGVGAGLTLYFGNFLISTRYNVGLQKVADSFVAQQVMGNAKNTSAQLSVGVTF